jgi:hypothetical protein
MIWTDWIGRRTLVFCYGLPIWKAVHKTRGFLRVSTNSNDNTSRTLLDVGHKIQKRDLNERTSKDIANQFMEWRSIRLTSLYQLAENNMYDLAVASRKLLILTNLVDHRHLD